MRRLLFICLILFPVSSLPYSSLQQEHYIIHQHSCCKKGLILRWPDSHKLIIVSEAYKYTARAGPSIYEEPNNENSRRQTQKLYHINSRLQTFLQLQVHTRLAKKRGTCFVFYGHCMRPFECRSSWNSSIRKKKCLACNAVKTRNFVVEQARFCKICTVNAY